MISLAILILSALLCGKNLHESYKIDKGNIRNIKIINAVFCFYLVLYNCNVFYSIGWWLCNFNKILDQHYIQQGIYPPLATLLSWILFIFTRAIALYQGMRLAKRLESARKAVVSIMPLLALSNLGDAFRYSNMLLNLNLNILLFAIIAIPYLLMYFFYKRKDVIDKLCIGR